MSPSPTHQSIIINSLNNRPFLPLIQSIQPLYISLVNLKIKHVGITPDILRVVALGQGHPILLQRVADQDLGGRLVVFLGQRGQRRVVGFVVAHERRVGRDDDVVVLAVSDDFALLAPRV